jgi:hypothetical protein
MVTISVTQPAARLCVVHIDAVTVCYLILEELYNVIIPVTFDWEFFCEALCHSMN